MTKEQLEGQLDELKADYARIQEDLEKLIFVGGVEASAEEQLVRLENEIADVRKQLNETE